MRLDGTENCVRERVADVARAVQSLAPFLGRDRHGIVEAGLGARIAAAPRDVMSSTADL